MSTPKSRAADNTLLPTGNSPRRPDGKKTILAISALEGLSNAWLESDGAFPGEFTSLVLKIPLTDQSGCKLVKNTGLSRGMNVSAVKTDQDIRRLCDLSGLFFDVFVTHFLH